MAKIKRARRSGEPGFITRSVEGYTGQRVGSDRVSKSRVRILFARDPAKNQRDPLGFTNHPDVPNPNAAPNPRILNGSSQARQTITKLAATAKRVTNRSSNRRISKR